MLPAVAATNVGHCSAEMGGPGDCAGWMVTRTSSSEPGKSVRTSSRTMPFVSARDRRWRDGVSSSSARVVDAAAGGTKLPASRATTIVRHARWSSTVLGAHEECGAGRIRGGAALGAAPLAALLPRRGGLLGGRARGRVGGMSPPGKKWRHVIINTHSSWLHGGCPRVPLPDGWSWSFRDG